MYKVSIGHADNYRLDTISETVDSEIKNFNQLLESINVLKENNILLEADEQSVWQKIISKIKEIIEKVKYVIKGIIIKIRDVIGNIIFLVKGNDPSLFDDEYDDFEIDWDDDDFVTDIDEAISRNTLKSNIEKMASNPYVFTKYSEYINVKSIPNITSKFVRAGLSNDNLSMDNLDDIEKMYNSCVEDIMGSFQFTKASNLYSSAVVGYVVNELYKRIHDKYANKSYTYDQLVHTIRTNLEDNRKTLEVLVDAEKRLYKVLDEIPGDLNQSIKENENNATEVGRYYAKFISLINSFNHIISALSKSLISSVSKASAIITYINANGKMVQK